MSIRSNKIADRRKMLKTEIGRARGLQSKFKSHQVEDLYELNENTLESKNLSLKTYLM